VAVRRGSYVTLEKECNAFSIDFLFIFFNSKTLIPLEIIAIAVEQKKEGGGVRNPSNSPLATPLLHGVIILGKLTLK